MDDAFSVVGVASGCGALNTEYSGCSGCFRAFFAQLMFASALFCLLIEGMESVLWRLASTDLKC